MIREDGQSLNPLRRQWLIAAAIYLAALLVSYNLLRPALAPGQSRQWLLLATASMAAQMAILWWALPYNRRPESSSGSNDSGASESGAGESGAIEHGGSRLLPVLGYANALTLLRGLLACLLAGFLFAPQPRNWLAWAPAILYTSDRLVDFVDGYVARVTHGETKLGEILDIEFDGLGILIAVMLGIQYGKLPPWYLVLGLTRPLFVLGTWLRRRAGLPVYDLPPSEHRRVVAGFQTGFITLILWPPMPAEVTLLAAYVMAVPLVFSFTRDWLVVSGALDAAAPLYSQVRSTAKLLLEGWLPLVARFGAALLVLPILWQAGAAGAGVQNQPQFLGGVTLLGLLAVASVLAGAAGRIGALVLAAIAALNIADVGLQWNGNAPLLVCALIVTHLGSGKLALWRPEEPLLRAKAGAPRT